MYIQNLTIRLARAVVKVENGHRGISIFSRAPSPYLRAPRNSTGPLIFLTGPIAGLILRIFMDSTYLSLATSGHFFHWPGGVQIEIFHTPKAFFSVSCRTHDRGGLGCVEVLSTIYPLLSFPFMDSTLPFYESCYKADSCDPLRGF